MYHTTCVITIVVLILSTFALADFVKVLPFSNTCMDAKLDYWERYSDVKNAILDPVWHYQNAPSNEGRTWGFALCEPTSIYPNDSICDCHDSATAFVEHYIWLSVTEDTAFSYWVNHQNQADGGIVWHCEYCSNYTPPNQNLPYNCTCLAAGWDYLQRYPDVVAANLDPVFHYRNSGAGEGRLWDCSLCDATSIYPNSPICNCSLAAKNYTNTYPWRTGVTLASAFGMWLSTGVSVGETWHCELCIPNKSNIRQYSAALSGGLSAIVGVGFLLGIFASIFLATHWSDFAHHGSFYSAVITAGVILSYFAAVVLLPPPSDSLCMVFPWLLGTSFILVYGCLFIKTWAIYRVWSSAIRYKRTALTPRYITKALALALGCEIIFLIIWTLVDPPKVKLNEMVDGTLQYECKSNTITFWAIFIAVKGGWLLCGVVLSILTRNVVKEYNESSSIAYAMYNDIGLAIVAVPLTFILSEVPGGALVIEVAAIVLAFTFTLCILFFDIWYGIFFREKDIVGDKLKEMRQYANSTSSTASGRSPLSTASVTTSVGL